MSRASDAQKAERLNRARTLLRDFDQLPDAVGQLAQDCSISPRQAYRYLQQAQRLKKPLAVSEPKLAFTVKLPPSLIQRVRLYASVKNLSISEVVSRALLALLPPGARPWLRAAPLGTFVWNIGLIVCLKRNWHKSFKPWRPRSSASWAQSPKPRRP